MAQIGQSLGGVIEIALQVDHGSAVRQNAMLVAFLNGIGHLFLIAVTFANEHVITNTDNFG